jgi:hypothetical protein
LASLSLTPPVSMFTVSILVIQNHLNQIHSGS